MANGAAVMYTNVGSKGSKETIEDFIQGDINSFKATSPSIKITSSETVVIERGKKALVRLFSGDTNGNFEAVGYIDEPKVVVMVVLTSRTKKDFDAALPAFSELLKSYFFISSDVVIQK